jgi:hypothetical protein
MAEEASRSSTYISLGLVVAALVIAAVTGFGEGSIAGAIVAGAAIIPAAIGMWKGMQEKTQAGLGLAVGTFFLALGVAALLLILKIVDWIK